MQWDKTEMLFYLQEERRKHALTSSHARKELTMDGFIGSLEVAKDRQARVRYRNQVMSDLWECRNDDVPFTRPFCH